MLEAEDVGARVAGCGLRYCPGPLHDVNGAAAAHLKINNDGWQQPFDLRRRCSALSGRTPCTYNNRDSKPLSQTLNVSTALAPMEIPLGMDD